MHDFLISIGMILILTTILFLFSYIFIKILKINHPKDKSKIYTMTIASVLFMLLLSFTVVGNTQINQNKLNDPSNKVDNLDSSLIIVIDETQDGNNNASSSIDSTDHICQPDLSCNHEKETFNQPVQKVISFLIQSPENISYIVSQLKSGNLNLLMEEFDNEITVNDNTICTNQPLGLQYDNLNKQQSNVIPLFILFNIILIVICVAYLLFSFILGKKIILKNVNAEKCNDLKILNMVQNLCKEIKIKTPKIYTYAGDPNAFIFGYPTSLVISKNLIKYLPEAELRIALRHELAHISNKDHILKPLLQSMRILFFYNPIVHILFKKIINERELLADSKFIESKNEKIKFIEILCKINDLSKTKKLFSNSIYGSSSLLLVSYKTKKLEITDRFDHLFTKKRKKSLITTIICFFILFSNIAAIVIAQKSFSDNTIDNNQKIEPITLSEKSVNKCDNLVSVVYIMRLIQKDSKSLDLIIIEENLCD